MRYIIVVLSLFTATTLASTISASSAIISAATIISTASATSWASVQEQRRKRSVYENGQSESTRAPPPEPTYMRKQLDARLQQHQMEFHYPPMPGQDAMQEEAALPGGMVNPLDKIGEPEDINIDVSQSRVTVRNADQQLSIALLATYPAGYNVLPVEDALDTMQISVQMALYSIVDMDERDQMLTTNCEIITKWNDLFLTWDPSRYNNITDTRLPWDKVWTPDIVLYNSAGDGEQGREMRTLIQVDYQGNVTLLTQGIYMTKCQIDVTHYPFDPQRCSLKFASWTTEITRLNLSIGDIPSAEILRMYSDFGVFELRQFYGKRHEVYDPCCEDPFVYITYYLVIWRKPKFFLFNYIQPSVLINLLALFVFLIPAESGEKITLGISTMLNMTIFLMTVMSGLPPTDRTPIVSIYFSITMFVTTAATIMGVVILRIHHQGRRGSPVPPNLRQVAKALAWLTRSSYPDTLHKLQDLEEGRYNSEAKDSYQYNIREYNDRVKVKSKAPESLRKMSCDILPHLSSLPGRKKTVSFSERKQSDSEMSTDTDGRTPDTDVTDSVSDNEEEEKSGSARKIARARKHWKIGIGKVIENVRKETVAEEEEETKQSWFTLIQKVLEDRKRGQGATEERRSLLPREGADNELAEENFWEEMDKMCRSVVEDSWRKFMSDMWEDRWRAEDRKEIIGEEWRKISRILDRFLLILLTSLSVINTLWCIVMSPYLLGNSFTEEIEEDEAKFLIK